MVIILASNTTTIGQGWYSGIHPWFIFGFLFWLVPLIIFGIAVVLVARWLSGRGGHENDSRGGNTAVRILEERYAKGEITKEQFERMKKDLRG